ncbi:MAG: hypothetical protein ACRDL9_11170 [Trebonia sp.]
MTAFWALIAFLLSYGAYLNAVNETGTDSGSGPFIMRVIIVATGAADRCLLRHHRRR